MTKPVGAPRRRRDIPNATVEFLDTGHFALGTHLNEIAEAMHKLLSQTST
ncbi:MAG TPA: hypothetical protein VN875_05065 [Candidatus Binatus sp.]|nr:hypothetical protein [Candidatus Binatus sp.]